MSQFSAKIVPFYSFSQEHQSSNQMNNLIFQMTLLINISIIPTFHRNDRITMHFYEKSVGHDFKNEKKNILVTRRQHVHLR